MPVLAANQVTLAEVLEVKGVPLNEEEIWAILCQASRELELLLAQGKGKHHGQPSLLISPETLILSYLGQVKVSVALGREKSKNVTYRAPELSSRTVAPSDGAMEKMYVYSLGMTVYFAATYEQTKPKMAQLSVSLGNLLLSMCEELARTRYTLRQVLEACGSKYGEHSYREIVKGLVVLVLGNNIPKVTQNDDSIPKPRTLWNTYNSDDQHPSRGIRSRYGSSLELPSPPLVQRLTHSQATAAEHVGSNDRTPSSPEEQHAYHSQNQFMTKIPHTLDKYRKYLGKARHKKADSTLSPVVADRSIGTRNHYGSMPVMNGRHSLGSERPSRQYLFERAQTYPEEDKGYEEGAADGSLSRSRIEKLRSAGSGSFGNIRNAHSSDASSETSSLSDNQKSTLSSAQSSSLLSLMEGSYVPGSSLADHGSDIWGSMGSLRDNDRLSHSGEWHHSSISDLRSVSELSNTVHGDKQYNGFTDTKQWAVSNGQLDKQRKYRSEQNLVSPDNSDGGKRQRKVPKAKLRKFFGPEFVQVTEDPNKSLVNITPKKDKKVYVRRMVTVVMLNEQKLEMAVESSTKVQELFLQITKYIGVTEKIYFGLTRLEDDEHFFLDFDSKISKYAPSGWKKQSKKSMTEYTLYFRVKFYVENLSLLRHHATIHQLYLQLRSDIVHDRFHCDEEPALNLASLAVQSEYGDYNRKHFGENYFKPRHYLPSRVLVKIGDSDVSQKLCALHKVQCGLDQEEAELKFIKDVQKLPEYGIYFYSTKWNKQENQSIYLGVCVRGVTVYEPKGDRKSPIETHSWQMIKKLSFKKKKFYIHPRTEGDSGKGNKISFLNSSYKKSKYLLYMCTSFHRFQMRMKVRLLSMDDAPKDKKGKLSSILPYKTKSFDHLNGDAYDSEPSVNGSVKNNGLNNSFEERNSDSRRPSVGSGKEMNGYQDPSHASEVRNHEQPVSRSSPYVLDSSPRSPSSYSDRTPSPKQGRPATDAILSPDRKVKIVKLRKDSRGALGLTVVGGEDTRRLHLGIFIKKITTGSAADQDGRLQVGDRILAVNGKSLEFVSHDEAVQTLKNAPVEVELLVSQSTNMGGDIDMSTMTSPALDKQPSSVSRDARASPYLFEEQSPVPNTTASRQHTNHDAPETRLNREPESPPKPPAYKTIPRQKGISESSSDAPVSKPSSTEPSTRGIPRGGVKLPGMENGRVLEGSIPTRKGPSTSSRTSRVGEESPGSIASYVEKVHRRKSLPQSESTEDPHVDAREFSLGSASGDTGLGRSRSDSGVRQEDDEGTDGRLVTRGDSRENDVVSRSRTSSGRGASLEEVRDSASDLSQLPVGIVWGNQEAKKTGENVTEDYSTIELDKESGSLGLNVTGGTNTNVKDGAIYVKSLYPNGPADLDGRIQVGHKIISVNGISLQGVTHKQAVETIKRAPSHIVLIVEVEQHGSLPSQSQTKEKEVVFEVVLVKGIGGLGMSLVGGTDYVEEYGEAIRIKAMFPGQPAMNSEQLRVGDVIFAANGISLEGKTNRDAINVLRDQPPRVVLAVKRDPASIPPGLLRRGSFSQNLNPDEMLSAIHSKLRKDDSRRSEVSVYSDVPDHEGDTRGSCEGDTRGSREGDTRGSREDDTRGSRESDTRGSREGASREESLRRGEEGINRNNLVVRENVPLPSQQFVDVASVLSEQPSNVPPPPPEGSDYVNDDDVLEESAGQVNNGRTYSGEVEDERRLSTNSAGAASGAVFLSPDENKKDKLAPDEEIIDLVLHKGSSGLGFTLAGGADTVGGCFVREIIGDPARSDGRLRPKDQIVMVNGQDTTNKKHMEAVNILRSTRKEVHLVVRRMPDKVKSRTKDGLDIKTVSVIRTTRGRIGLTLAEDKDGQIYAEDVVPDEPAAKDGGLKRGDIIMEINGERVDKSDLQFAETCLDEARPVVTIVIKQFRSESESKYVISSPTESEQDHPVLKSLDPSPHEYETKEQRRQKYSQDKCTQNRLPEENGPAEQRPSEQRPSEHIPSEQRPSEQRPSEQRPSEQKPSEQRPSEQSPSEERPSEERPSEQSQQEKRSHEQPLFVRQSHIQQYEVLPYENQSLEHAPSEHLPSGAQSSYGNRQSFNENYSRYKSSESSEFAHIDTGLQALPTEGNVGEDSGEERVPEDYQSEDDDDDDDDDDILIKEDVFVTTLEKGLRGLGFSLFSGRTIHDTPGLFIRSIQPESVVAQGGKIKIGDQLLKVNDENVEKLNHSEVITMLRKLSGMVRLEMLRVHDADEDDDDDQSFPIQTSEASSHGKNQELSHKNERVVSTEMTPDFTEDLSIVLSALDKNQDNRFPDVKSEESPHEPAERMVDSGNSSQSSLRAGRPLHTETKENEDDNLESWPKPPTSLDLQPPGHANISVVVQDTKDVDHNDNLTTTSDDDNTSVTFSEDDFLEHLEDFVYTPSAESEAGRPGFGLGGSQSQATFDGRSTELEVISTNSGTSGVSRIPVKQGSSISKDFRIRLNNPDSFKGGKNSGVPGEENIEMSSFKKDDTRDTGYLSTSREGTPRIKGDSRVSPLIPESFLNASQAISPDVPPPAFPPAELPPLELPPPELPPLELPPSDIPPPVPTTPIPSDDDLGPKPPERIESLAGMRERFGKVASEEGMPKGRFDYPLRPKSPLVHRRSPSTKSTGPLIELTKPSARYSGDCLKYAVRKLEDAISSGQVGNEYQALREVKAIDSCPSGKRALNKEKNRYKNVLPYEKTRVILSGDEQMDYINANYINITVGSVTRNYIATQGPLPITMEDFWKMVWEQKSQVIAMVTLDMESGKVKCHRYWPESPELPLNVYNGLEVHLEAVETRANFVQRQMKIKNIESSEFLNVTHLNYVAWPDHGVPKSACELVEFIKQIRSYSNSGPCVVHCSAGIGRTGTLLAIDTCLRHIEKGLEFDIYSIVCRLREQRPGMIQTKDQYLLCYQACVEVLKSLEGYT